MGLRSDAMGDPLIRAFLAKLEREEIIPIVPPVPDTDLHSYFELIERRLLNPKIGDTIPRLAQDGSNRQPKFILPSTQDRIRLGLGIKGLSLVSALWCHYLNGRTDSGKDISFNDPNIDRIRDYAVKSKTNHSAFLEMKDIFGELGANAQFKEGFVSALTSLQTAGTKATLSNYLNAAD